MTVKNTYSEEELVTMLRQRSDAAFGYLYDNYAAALLGIISSIVNEKETANDVLQDVFLNIWRKIESYETSKGRLFTWMLNVARNAAIDKIRSRDYQNTLKNRSMPENVDTSIGGAVADPTINDVGLKRILTRLKNDQRILIDLSYFQGFTHEEIARTLNIPLGTVKTRIRSALTLLRTMLQ